MILQMTLYFFLLATFVQLFYWLFIFSRLARYEVAPKGAKNLKIAEPPVSIIICAHNEEKNLEKNLPRILNQNYRSFEVIVVNDNSTDLTYNTLLNIKYKYPTLRIINALEKPKNQAGKKFALGLGIKKAKYKILLLTDADCFPNSRNWLREMQKAISGSTEIGLGYGPYTKNRGLLNLFIRYETVYTAVQYFSFALFGFPYMGVGRNLIYKKSLFEKAGGFKKHKHIVSGDDDLFINAIANQQNVGIILNKNAFMYSEPKDNWQSYFIQKSRHVSTGKHYKLKHKVLLGLLSLSHLIHYVGGIVMVLNNTCTVMVLLMYLVRIAVVLAMYRSILNKLEESSLLKWILFLDAFFLLYYLLFAPVVMIGNSQKWK